jgi:hypothetical protein
MLVSQPPTAPILVGPDRTGKPSKYVRRELRIDSLLDLRVYDEDNQGALVLVAQFVTVAVEYMKHFWQRETR